MVIASRHVQRVVHPFLTLGDHQYSIDMASASASKGKAPETAKFIDAEGYEMPW